MSKKHRTARRVVKLSTGEIFETAVDAARSVGVTGSAMSRHLNGISVRTGGEIFHYEGEEPLFDLSTPFGHHTKSVVKLSTGEVFPTVTEASNHAGVPRSNMSEHLKGKVHHIRGEVYHFEGAEPKVDINKPMVTLRKRVENAATGEIFESVKDAASDADVHHTTMSKHLNGRKFSKTCKNYRFVNTNKLITSKKGK